MNSETLSLLEFDKVINNICAYCVSSEGAEKLKKIVPSTDFEQIRKTKNFCLAWTNVYKKNNLFRVTGWENISGEIHSLSVKGFCLEASSILKLGLFFKSAIGLLNQEKWLEERKNDFTDEKNILITELSKLPDLTVPCNEVFSVIDEAGELRDLPALKEIRKRISVIKNNIGKQVKTYFAGESYKTFFQSTVPSDRDGRTVLAVKANFKGRIKGIVHEVSQTGQTIYLEPSEIVELNNELVKEENEFHIEVHKILKTLTEKLSGFIDEIKTALSLMEYFDIVCAVSKWCLEKNCVYIEDANKGIVLLKARHPLLKGTVIPVDIIVPENTKILLITGPNTGGKTVSMKTLGLFSLLNQCGFPVPAAEGSSLPFFKGVYGDLGDNQSLEQSLSTFSAQMKNISYICENAENSLVLLDEIGSGTDPEEGSGLAMAIFDFLSERAKFVMATTHQNVLKNYIYSKDNALNASMEFDDKNLVPTYRMIMGVPGESYALEIARLNSLPGEIIDKAQKYISSDRANVSKMIQSLGEKYQELEKLENEKKLLQRVLIEKQRTLDLKELSLKQKENELKKSGIKKYEDFVLQTRKELENLIRKIREGELTKEKTTEAKEFMNKITETLKNEESAIENERLSLIPRENFIDGSDLKSHGFAPGDEVFVKDENHGTQRMRSGIIQRKYGKNKWQVSIGSMTISVTGDRLEKKQKNPVTPKITVEYDKDMSSKAAPAFQLDIRGFRVEEARKAVEQQLERAILNNLSAFSIIHGTGEGVLQTVVQETLKAFKGVKKFYYALPEDGGTGKTYVEMN